MELLSFQCVLLRFYILLNLLIRLYIIQTLQIRSVLFAIVFATSICEIGQGPEILTFQFENLEPFTETFKLSGFYYEFI